MAYRSSILGRLHAPERCNQLKWKLAALGRSLERRDPSCYCSLYYLSDIVGMLILPSFEHQISKFFCSLKGWWRILSNFHLAKILIFEKPKFLESGQEYPLLNISSHPFLALNARTILAQFSHLNVRLSSKPYSFWSQKLPNHHWFYIQNMWFSQTNIRVWQLLQILC